MNQSRNLVQWSKSVYGFLTIVKNIGHGFLLIYTVAFVLRLWNKFSFFYLIRFLTELAHPQCWISNDRGSSVLISGPILYFFLTISITYS